MDLDIQGDVAIVTGGTRGIGRAVVETLLAEGVRVASGSRQPEDFEGMATGDALWSGPLDVTDPDSIRWFVDQVRDRFGPVHMLVNNAGKAHPGSFTTLDDEAWRRDIDVKLMAQVRMTRCVLEVMPDGGRIVNLTAVFGKQPHPRFFASSVNRAACTSLTKALAQELAPRNIRVNAASIGFVHSGQWASRPDSFFRETVDAFGVALGRFGQAQEAADAICYLLSQRASYLTGVVLDIDGGMAQYL